MWWNALGKGLVPLVMGTTKELDLEKGKDFELIEAGEGTPGREVVLKEGGLPQVPFMIDGETKMYESGDIVEYLKKKFSK